MNILLIGFPNMEIIDVIKSSKRLGKLYTTVKIDGLSYIDFDNFNDLVYKAKALEIDVAINLDKDLIEAGVFEFFKASKINLISVNKKWLNLETSRIATKHLLEYYSINVPKTIKAPLSFPVVMKSNNGEIIELVDSMEDLIEKTKYTEGEVTYLEEYLDGEGFDLSVLWDGKNLMACNSPNNMTEVKADRLELFKTKLNFLLSDEQADFIGFFTVRLIWVKNDWYVNEFIMNLNKKPDLTGIKSDFLYVLYSAIYQKLNEF